MILRFGKYRGESVKDVPFQYLLFLAGEREECNGFEWVEENHPEVVEYAKNSLIGICHSCGTKLVPIGKSRVGGKDHKDWYNRKYHKKCWKEMMDEDD